MRIPTRPKRKPRVPEPADKQAPAGCARRSIVAPPRSSARGSYRDLGPSTRDEDGENDAERISAGIDSALEDETAMSSRILGDATRVGRVEAHICERRSVADYSVQTRGEFLEAFRRRVRRHDSSHRLARASRQPPRQDESPHLVVEAVSIHVQGLPCVLSAAPR
jgi:hypothetical protein